MSVDQRTFTVAGPANYAIEVLLEGFPGQTTSRGGLGWSTIAVLRGKGRVALVDVGSFGARSALRERLAAVGVDPGEVTDLLLTHAHYDHIVNWPLFPDARIVIGADELAWATAGQPDWSPVPELYVRALVTQHSVTTVDDGDEVLPGVKAYCCPGHTPGHIVFAVHGDDRDVIFTGDAAKNRAELMSRRAAMTYDEALSKATIDRIWTMWERRPGSILIPGHDLPLLTNGRECWYVDSKRDTGIDAWLGADLTETTRFDLQ